MPWDTTREEIRQAQVFVAVLGASNLTYAEARWTQSLPDWIGCHVGAFASFGGVARQIVCDNLKAGVTAASRYEPGISRTYQTTTARRSRRRGCASRATRPRSRLPSRSCNAGSGPGCATGGSSPWPS